MDSTEHPALKVGRLWLLGLLALVPFQLSLVNLLGRSAAITSYADEMSLLGLAGLTAVLRWRGQVRPVPGERILAGGLVLFFVVAAASAVHNQTGLIVFLLGASDYVKSIGFVWIAASLADEDFKRRLLRLVLWIATAAATWAFVEMAVATQFFSDDLAPSAMRFGLVRPRGPLGHANILGLYVLLALILELTVGRRRNGISALLSLGALLSMSRIVHAAFLVVISPVAIRKKWLAAPILVSLAFTISASSLTDREFSDASTEALASESQAPDPTSYRAVTMKLGLQLWRDHPTLGVGPGRFGGWVSLATDSPVYREHPLPERHMRFFGHIRSIDQFYPQLLAELGVLGAASYAALGIALLVLLLWRLRRGFGGPQREWAAAAALCLVVVPVYCFGAGLNLSAYLVTAMTVCGIALAAPDGRSTA